MSVENEGSVDGLGNMNDDKDHAPGWGIMDGLFQQWNKHACGTSYWMMQCPRIDMKLISQTVMLDRPGWTSYIGHTDRIAMHGTQGLEFEFPLPSPDASRYAFYLVLQRCIA